MIRLLRVEARRNPTPLVLPLLALLLWITPLAQDLHPVALWLDRSVDVEGSVQLIGPFAAGTAAWMASRESRRTMDDLLATTPHSPLARTLATWLVTAGWMVLFYLGLCAVFLSVTAEQATWGSLLWWPSIVGLFAAIMCSATGFALGRRFPSLFTTPLVAVGMLTAILGVRSMAANNHAAGIGLLSPIYPSFGLNASVFYAPRSDLSMVKILMYIGILGIALGVTALYFRADRPSIRRTGTALLVVGIAFAATAGGLDATARSDEHGVIVSALDNTAILAVPYTPVCSHTPLPVCVHPAYAGGHEPAVLTTIINAITAPVLGVPGMPVRAEQVPEETFGVQGDPLILPIQPFIVHGTTLQPAPFDQVFKDLMALSLFVPAGTAPHNATPAQRALALYLIRQARYAADPHTLTPQDPAVAAAAARFGALTPTARTAWLTAHLGAIRGGRLTPTDIP